MTDADFEACSLWPIKIHLRDAAGYTLWGSGGGETDLLLAVGQRLRAFVRWPSLVEFVERGTDCNLAALDGYRALRARLEQPGNLVPDTIKEYPLATVATWFAVEPLNWTPEMRSTTVDCLNLLWDAATTLSDEPSRAMLRRDATPLGRLLDVLTFADDQTAQSEIAEALTSNAGHDYRTLLESLSGRWDVHS